MSRSMLTNGRPASDSGLTARLGGRALAVICVLVLTVSCRDPSSVSDETPDQRGALAWVDDNGDLVASFFVRCSERVFTFVEVGRNEEVVWTATASATPPSCSGIGNRRVDIIAAIFECGYDRYVDRDACCQNDCFFTGVVLSPYLPLAREDMPELAHRRVNIFALGSATCALTGVGAVATGICGAGAVLISQFLLTGLNNPGAPPSYCRSGYFDTGEAEAMGFDNTSEAVSGC